jgi:O-antigen ligase
MRARSKSSGTWRGKKKGALWEASIARTLENKREPLPRREWLLVIVSCATIGTLCWLFGGLRPVGNLAALLLGAVACATQFWPQKDLNGPSIGGRLRLLLRSPVFWFGLAFLLYTSIQAFNTAWTFKLDGTHWRIIPKTHLPWLPAGVGAPFPLMNEWRELMVHAGLFLWVCALLVGINHRRSWQWMFWFIAINATIMVAAGIIVRLSSDTSQILGVFPTTSPSFFGSFGYRNHAAAFLNGSLSVAAAIGIISLIRSQKRLRRSSVGYASVFFCLACLAGVVLTLSRGGALMSVIPAGVAGFSLLRTGSFWKNWKVLSIAVLLIAAFALFVGSLVWRAMPEDDAADRWETLSRELGSVVETGELSRISDRNFRLRTNFISATWDYFCERPIYGWGGGAFRWTFYPTQQLYPVLAIRGYSSGKDEGLIRFGLNHAHTDWLQFLAEYGLVGTFFAASALLALALPALQGWPRMETSVLLAGAFAIFLHAGFDFILQSPACLFLMVFILTAAGRLQSFSARRSAGKDKSS